MYLKLFINLDYTIFLKAVKAYSSIFVNFELLPYIVILFHVDVKPMCCELVEVYGLKHLKLADTEEYPFGSVSWLRVKI